MVALVQRFIIYDPIVIIKSVISTVYSRKAALGDIFMVKNGPVALERIFQHQRWQKEGTLKCRTNLCVSRVVSF